MDSDKLKEELGRKTEEEGLTIFDESQEMLLCQLESIKKKKEYMKAYSIDYSLRDIHMIIFS